MKIELRGNEQEFKRLANILLSKGGPICRLIAAEIEDQLEVNADRAHDFISLTDLFGAVT